MRLLSFLGFESPDLSIKKNKLERLYIKLLVLKKEFQILQETFSLSLNIMKNFTSFDDFEVPLKKTKSSVCKSNDTIFELEL